MCIRDRSRTVLTARSTYHGRERVSSRTTQPNLRLRTLAVLVAILSTLIGFGGTAAAQDDLPTGPPTDDTTTDDGTVATDEAPASEEPVVDFGFEVSDEGTVIWTDPTESQPEPNAPAPTTVDQTQSETTLRTGITVEQQEGLTADAQVEAARRDAVGELETTSGPSRAMWFVVLGLVILGAGLLALFVQRKARSDEDADDGSLGAPTSDNPMLTGEPAYAVSQEGGAANAAYSVPEPGISGATSKGSLKEQIIAKAEKGLSLIHI